MKKNDYWFLGLMILLLLTGCTEQRNMIIQGKGGGSVDDDTFYIDVQSVVDDTSYYNLTSANGSNTYFLVSEPTRHMVLEGDFE